MRHSREIGNAAWSCWGQERRFVPLGKGDVAFFAAGGAENAETPCGPVLKGNKKRPSVWPALHTEGTSALPGPLSPLGDYGQLTLGSSVC